MSDDLFESISQGGDSEETQENCRIYEIANEILRCCQLYDSKLRGSKENVSRLDIEQRATEQYAKSVGLWTPFTDIAILGAPGPSGNENDLYVSNDIVFKVNNLLNTGSILSYLKRLIWHNNIFYDTAYAFYGFTGFDGRSVMPIVQQRLVKNSNPATSIEIDTYMSALGFTKKDTGKFENQDYIVWDLLPRNVLKDADGDVYIIDAEILHKSHI